MDPVPCYYRNLSDKSLRHSQSLPVVLRVEADGLYGRHDNHHAQGHGNKQHDDVLGPVFQGQLFILVLLGLHHAGGSSGGGLPVLLWSTAIATSSTVSSTSTTITTSSSSGPCSGHCSLLGLQGGFRGDIGLLLVLRARKKKSLYFSIVLDALEQLK